MSDKLIISEKGDLTIEFTSYITIFLIMVVFIAEIVVAGYRHNLALKSAYRVCKTIAIQSGVTNDDAPSYYGQFRPRYVKLQAFKSLVDSLFIDEIEVSEYKIEVIHKDGLGQVQETVDLTNNTTGIRMDYGDLFDVKITYKFPLKLINNVLSSNLDSQGTVVVSSLCEYKDYFQ